MKISFKADAEAIRDALDTIRIVPPPAITQDAGSGGFLFVVAKKVDKIIDKNADGTPGARDGQPGPNDGKDVCYVYSRNEINAARAEFWIYEVQGEGVFGYPSEYIESFNYVGGEITFEVLSDEENNKFSVRWSFGAGAFTEKAGTDPKQLASLDKKLNESTNHHTYCTAVLKEAIKMGKAFLASEQDRNARDEFKIINIYDSTTDPTGKGDGTLHTTDSYQRFYFDCPSFKGKGLQIHYNHIPLVESFLAKCGPEVVVCTGSEMFFAMSADGSRVLGWTRHMKPPLDFKYVPMSWDRSIVRVLHRDLLVQQLKFLMSEVEKGHDKIKVEYDHEEKHLRFRLLVAGKAASLPIEVESSKYDLPDTWRLPNGSRGYAVDVSVKWLLGLFTDVKAPVVEFRMFPTEEHNGAKGGAGLRTVDEFWLDREGKLVGGAGAQPDPTKAFQCKVSRFMPSKG